MPTEPANPLLASRSERLVSLDVLRGFDMFWIIGGKQILVAISVLTSAQWIDWTLARMKHPEWHGFEPWDLIFPLFFASCLDCSTFATPPIWNVLIVSCVPGSPIDCAAMIPTASPILTNSPLARFLP